MGTAKLLAAPLPFAAANGVEPDWNDGILAARDSSSSPPGRVWGKPLYPCGNRSPHTAGPRGGRAANRLCAGAAGPGPSPPKAKFDSQTKKLAYFLTQVWNYLERYGAMHADGSFHVNAITFNLKGDAAEWLGSLYNEGCRADECS